MHRGGRGHKCKGFKCVSLLVLHGRCHHGRCGRCRIRSVRAQRPAPALAESRACPGAEFARPRSGLHCQERLIHGSGIDIDSDAELHMLAAKAPANLNI